MVKTSCGLKQPLESVLVNPEFVRLLDAFEVPIIDEALNGNTIRSFMDELKAVGVAVDLSSALKLIVTQFKTPSESILFSSKWGTISLFVDLLLIDDSFYGIVIYGFEDELKMLGVITEFGGAPFVARGLTRPIEPRFVTDLDTIALIECIKYLISKFKEQPLLDNLFSNLMRSKWLKTRKVYKKPEECILFDPTWKVILEETDAPMIEHTFYKSEIFMYKNQLRAIGVKVDPGDVCSLLSRYLMSLTETSSITRTYNFLHMFNWKPELQDKSDYQVWVINHNDNSGEEWYALDKCYQKELLPFFSSAFAVAEFPSIDDYMGLWDIWVMRVNSQVTAKGCCSFLGLHFEELESAHRGYPEEEVNQSTRHHIYNIDGIPLFVWLLKCKSLSTIHPRRFFEIYESLWRLLACVKADAIENLSRIIQIGFMFEFKEESMFLLLTSEYLELFAEDEKFLDAAFLLPKQCPVMRYLPILPPIDDKSQLLTQPNLKESRRKVPNYPDPPKSSSSLYPKRSSQQLELLGPPTPESSQKKPRQ
ncbi:hypothetical protein AAG906_030029 [Vitis piasezkii]